MTRSNTLQRHAPLAFAAVGLLFFLLGAGVAGSNLAFARWGERVIGTVTDTGSVSAGSTTSYVAYEFTDPAGERRSGRSSGYSGTAGETILLEYLSVWPGWNRVAGAGRRAGKWQWWITGFGALFTLIGAQWFLATRKRARTKHRLERSGQRVNGKVTRLQSGTVHYEFEVRDAVVTGRTLGVGFDGIDELEPGGDVEVLFDPRAPELNVLALE